MYTSGIKNKGSAGPSFEEAKITSAALGPEERAEFDADPGKLSWTSAVPPGTLDAVIIFGRSLISTSKKLLVCQGSRVLILTERRPGRPRDYI